MIRLLALSVFALAVGCTASAHHRKRPRGYNHPQVSSIQVLSATTAAKQTMPSDSVSFAFGPRIPAAGLIAPFLRHCRDQHATAVSNIKVHLITAKNGRKYDCTTTIRVDRKFHVGPAYRHIPGYTTGRMVRRPVTTSVRTPVHKCMYESESIWNFGTRRPSFQTTLKCRWVTNTHTETNYKLEWELSYTPGHWERRLERRSRWELAESKASCVALAPDALRQSRVTGTIYGKNIQHAARERLLRAAKAAAATTGGADH